MGAISKESIRRSDAQLAAKQPRMEDDAALSPRPSSSFAPSSSSRVEASLTTIMDQFQHMRADFSSRLDHISDEICQINTRICRLARRQSHLGNFPPSPSLELTKGSSDGGDDGDDASVFYSDDEMTSSQ